MGIEVILEELQPDPLQVQVNRMKETAREMAKYYIKGFRTIVIDIIQCADRFVLGVKSEQDFVAAYEKVQEIERFYGDIRFGSLRDRQEFEPLFTARRLIPKFKEAIDLVRKEKDKESVRNLQSVGYALLHAGILYQETLFGLLQNIRTFFGHEQFFVKVPDQLKNRTWYFPQ